MYVCMHVCMYVYIYTYIYIKILQMHIQILHLYIDWYMFVHIPLRCTDPSPGSRDNEDTELKP